MDEAAAAALIPLTGWILANGADDLIVDLVWAWHLLSPKPVPPPAPRERLLAILVPLWQEHEVVAAMVAHNVTAIQYVKYHFFLCCYPNDLDTVHEVSVAAARFPRVHRATVPHDGPTSKADCLNWAYQTMLSYEEEAGVHFEGILIHDAEDLIHPASLAWINRYLTEYDMVQVPVLPLPTPAAELVHGVYIDEFSEFQFRDLQVRERLGGFLPSSGVGTGLSRLALERLATLSDGRVFEPGCLTEDYELGFRLRALGCRQTFLPLAREGSDWMATREYFPRTREAAERQRTRWVTGIVWQGWERHGWQGGWQQWWWHWRDRRGVIGNPLSIACQALFLYGLITLAAEPAWRFGELIHHGPAAPFLPATLTLALLQLSARIAIVYRHFGWKLALTVPLRVPVANWINAVASVRATIRFIRAKQGRTALAWLKTQHQYPNRFALQSHRPSLKEILVNSMYLTEQEWSCCVETLPPQTELTQWLTASGALSEEQLCEAISLQHCLPVTLVSPATLARSLVRALPVHVVQQWNVVPIGASPGSLHLAGPDPPSEEGYRALARFTRLRIEFFLIPRSTFEQILRDFL